jgi:hypothetical protein
MKKYEVYQGKEAVKEGFSWPGFFVAVLWTLSHRLWIQAILLAVAAGGLTVTAAVLQDHGMRGVAFLLRLCVLGVFAFAGLKGNEWRRQGLLKRGYASLGTVEAESASVAVAGPPQA